MTIVDNMGGLNGRPVSLFIKGVATVMFLWLVGQACTAPLTNAKGGGWQPLNGGVELNGHSNLKFKGVDGCVVFVYNCADDVYGVS